MKTIRILHILFFCLVCQLDAGEYIMWSKAELMDKSDLIVVGQVKHISETLKNSKIKLGGGRILPTKSFLAEIAVEKIEKGNIKRNKSINFLYFRINDAKVVDPYYIHRVFLEKNHRYRFYLKKTNDGYFVPALIGEFNTMQSAEPTKPNKEVLLKIHP